VVLVAKLDRLGPSLLHLLGLIEHLNALGLRLVSASDSIDTKTPAGRMMLQLLGAFAEFERERLRERSIDGAYRRALAGGFVGSSPPFGYRPVPDPTGQAADPRQAHRTRVIPAHQSRDERLCAHRAVTTIGSPVDIDHVGRDAAFQRATRLPGTGNPALANSADGDRCAIRLSRRPCKARAQAAIEIRSARRAPERRFDHDRNADTSVPSL
jgi:hypothetical protein